MRRSGRPPLGRAALGPIGRPPLRRLPEGHSLLVVGPTQAGKTSSIVVPAALAWEGPVVLTSVKSDVVELTRPWRSSLGPVVELRPGLDGGSTWDPLEAVTTHREALGLARDLVVGERSRASAESEFWNALAVKLLGALALAVRNEGGDVFDLVETVETRRWLDEPMSGHGPGVDRAIAAVRDHEARTADAVTTTVEAMLTPWLVRQPLAKLSGVLEGGTVYLVAPRHEQRRYEGLFRGALRAIVAEQQRLHEARRSRELLLVLDEAASVAPLEDLDQLAATGRGLGVTLLSVFQDFAQIEARWGERAATIVNNHATRLVLGGLADPRATTYLPELAGGEGSRPLRTWPEGTAALVSGRRPLERTRLVPWWRQRRLAHRAPSLEVARGPSLP